MQLSLSKMFLARLSALPVVLVLIATWPSTAYAGAGARVQLGSSGLVITGQVMIPGTRLPLAGIEVELSPPDPTWVDLMSGKRSAVVVTDVSGRFAFTELTAATYELRARPPKDGSSSSGSIYSLQRKTVELDASRPLPPVEFWLTPMATLSGRVFDASGQPVANGSVTAVSLIEDAGGLYHRRPLAWGGLKEDGSYALSVPPGNYYIRVQPGDENLVGALLYYPGVTKLEDAVPVAVRAAANIPAIDISARSTPRADAFHVQFRLSMPTAVSQLVEAFPCPRIAENGEAQDDDCRAEEMLPVEAAVGRIGSALASPDITDVDLEDLGENVYLLPALPPGRYFLTLAHPSGLARTYPAVNWDLLTPIARLDFVVEDRDLDLGTVAYSSRHDIPGRIVQGNVTSGFDIPGASDLLLVGTSVRSATSKEDGSFVIQAVPPGTYRFEMHTDPLPKGTYVASVRSGGQDVMNDGLIVGDGLPSPIEVTFAADSSRLQGVVRNAASDLLPDARVVLIPPPQLRGPQTEFPVAVADAFGAFLLDGVAPGEYRILALDVAGRPDVVGYPYWETPTFLRKFELRGERIVIDGHTEVTLNLEAIRVTD